LPGRHARASDPCGTLCDVRTGRDFRRVRSRLGGPGAHPRGEPMVGVDAHHASCDRTRRRAGRDPGLRRVVVSVRADLARRRRTRAHAAARTGRVSARWRRGGCRRVVDRLRCSGAPAVRGYRAVARGCVMSPPRLRIILLSALMAVACGSSGSSDMFPAADLARMTWSEVTSRARGTTVRYAMWAGDEARNRFYQGSVADALRQDLEITLTIVPLGDTSDLVSKLVTEKAAGLRRGSVDLVWINGANFRTAKQAGILWGPFVQALPNLQYFDPVAIQHDFGTTTDGLEAPYEQAQFVFAYDTARIAPPPATFAELRSWIHDHPGRFTYPAIPDFTGSSFARHFLLHSGEVPPSPFAERFDAGLYDRVSKPVIEALHAMTEEL